MRINRIRQCVERRPFKPFEFVLITGDRVRVRHPDFVFIITDDDLVVVDNGKVRIFGPDGVAAIEMPREKHRKSAS